MDLAREMAAELSDQGQVRITQKGHAVSADARGPIRLGPGESLEL